MAKETIGERLDREYPAGYRLIGDQTMPNTRDKLSHALIVYDTKQSTRRGYNRYAMAQYLAALDGAMTDVQAGTSIRAALVSHFCDRLLDALLRAIGEPIATETERGR